MTLHQFMRAKLGTTLLAFVVLMTVLCAVLPTCAQGQTWRGYSVSQPAADCNLRRVSSDNFIGDGRRGTITAPRYQLHLISIGTAVVATVAVRELLHLSPAKSAALGGLGVGLLPHYRGAIIQRRYPINPGDVVADATMRMIPFMVVDGHKSHSVSGHLRTAFVVAAAYASVFCWASP